MNGCLARIAQQKKSECAFGTRQKETKTRKGILSNREINKRSVLAAIFSASTILQIRLFIKMRVNH